MRRRHRRRHAAAHAAAAPPTPRTTTSTAVADVVPLGASSRSPAGGASGRTLVIALAALLALAATFVAGMSTDHAGVGVVGAHRRMLGLGAAGLMAAAALGIVLTAL